MNEILQFLFGMWCVIGLIILIPTYIEQDYLEDWTKKQKAFMFLTLGPIGMIIVTTIYTWMLIWKKLGK